MSEKNAFRPEIQTPEGRWVVDTRKIDGAYYMGKPDIKKPVEITKENNSSSNPLISRYELQVWAMERQIAEINDSKKENTDMAGWMGDWIGEKTGAYETGKSIYEDQIKQVHSRAKDLFAKISSDLQTGKIWESDKSKIQSITTKLEKILGTRLEEVNWWDAAMNDINKGILKWSKPVEYVVRGAYWAGEGAYDMVAWISEISWKFLGILGAYTIEPGARTIIEEDFEKVWSVITYENAKKVLALLPGALEKFSQLPPEKQAEWAAKFVGTFLAPIWIGWKAIDASVSIGKAWLQTAKTWVRTMTETSTKIATELKTTWKIAMQTTKEWTKAMVESSAMLVGWTAELWLAGAGRVWWTTIRYVWEFGTGGKKNIKTEKISKEANLAEKIEKAEARSGISHEVVIRNAQLSPEDRLKKASELLWKQLSPEQEQAILSIHEEISKWVYQNGHKELRAMVEKLDSVGISREDGRVLMENGVLGANFDLFKDIGRLLMGWGKGGFWSSDKIDSAWRGHFDYSKKLELVKENIPQCTLSNQEKLYSSKSNMVIWLELWNSRIVISSKDWEFFINTMTWWKIPIPNNWLVIWRSPPYATELWLVFDTKVSRNHLTLRPNGRWWINIVDSSSNWTTVLKTTVTKEIPKVIWKSEQLWVKWEQIINNWVEERSVNRILSGSGEVFENSKIKGAGNTFANIKKPGRINEDRMFIDSEKWIMVSLDWMWWHGSWDKAASILANAIKQYPDDINNAIKVAWEEIGAQRLWKAWTCFTYSKLSEVNWKKYVDFYWAGDTKGVVISKSGVIKSETKDQSFVQMLVDQWHISQKGAGSHPKRNEVANYVWEKWLFDPDFLWHQRIEVQPWDRVFVYSDWISDNLTASEIARIIWSEEEWTSIIQKITGTVKNRRENDWFLSDPKSDDISIWVFVVK